MFIKTDHSKGHTYLKIAESYRVDGKIKHRIKANLGRTDVLAESGLENIIESLSKYVKNEKSGDKRLVSKIDIEKMEEVGRSNYGYKCYRELWNKYGISEILSENISGRKIRYDLVERTFSLVVNRLLSPSSKLGYYKKRAKYKKINEELELHEIYRTMDVLSETKEAIEKGLYFKGRELFNSKLDIVFYDVTTFYFESQESDELRDYGYSKDCKVNEVQVVMGLLIDKEGKPIGYEMYRGNTFDSKTLLKILEKMKKKFNIEKVIIVADKGINSKMNLKEIRERGFDYVVSTRIKSMPDNIKNKILDKEGYTVMEGKDFTYKVIEYENILKIKEDEGDKVNTYRMAEKMICTYSPSRARKDKFDRERMQMKAEEKIKSNDKTAISQMKGYKKYIKVIKSKDIIKLELDKERLKSDEMYDGFYAIQSSQLNLSARDVIDGYHNLYKIEESFRVLKTNMKTRPIFHYTPKRIEGHFVICFLAFLLERELESILKRKQIESSPEKIKEALNSLEFTELKIKDETYYLKSRHEELASKILSELRIKQPQNLMNNTEFEKFISN